MVGRAGLTWTCIQNPTRPICLWRGTAPHNGDTRRPAPKFRVCTLCKASCFSRSRVGLRSCAQHGGGTQRHTQSTLVASRARRSASAPPIDRAESHRRRVAATVDGRYPAVELTRTSLQRVAASRLRLLLQPSIYCCCPSLSERLRRVRISSNRGIASTRPGPSRV